MKRLLFIFSFFFLFVLNGKTQEVELLTLEDCHSIGIYNNLSLEGKRKEIKEVFKSLKTRIGDAVDEIKKDFKL